MRYILSPVATILKKRDTAIDACSSVVDSVSDWHRMQKKCDKFVSKEPLTLKYCGDRHKTQEMCDKAGNTCLQIINAFLIDLLQIECLKKFIMFSDTSTSSRFLNCDDVVLEICLDHKFQ